MLIDVPLLDYSIVAGDDSLSSAGTCIVRHAEQATRRIIRGRRNCSACRTLLAGSAYQTRSSAAFGMPNIATSKTNMFGTPNSSRQRQANADRRVHVFVEALHRLDVSQVLAPNSLGNRARRRAT